MARPEGFEPPTAWFVASNFIANLLFIKLDYRNARCLFCITMHNNA